MLTFEVCICLLGFGAPAWKYPRILGRVDCAKFASRSGREWRLASRGPGFLRDDAVQPFGQSQVGLGGYYCQCSNIQCYAAATTSGMYVAVVFLQACVQRQFYAVQYACHRRDVNRMLQFSFCL